MLHKPSFSVIVLVLLLVSMSFLVPMETFGAGKSRTTADSGGKNGFVAWYNYLALDSSGFPVVSYHDTTNNNLKVMRCNDALRRRRREYYLSRHYAQCREIHLPGLGQEWLSSGQLY